jgi:hypothetical protein
MLVSEIGAIVPAEALLPVEERHPSERDRREAPQPRRPRKRSTDDELVAVEPHRLDIEA